MECSYGCLSNFDLPPPESPSGRNKLTVPDESYFGGKEKNKHANQRRHAGRGAIGKAGVMAMLERGGEIRALPIHDSSRATLHGAIKDHVEPGSTIYTDEAVAYGGLTLYSHATVPVCHSREEYVRGDVHTNTAEGYFANLKRGPHRIYHHVGSHYLTQYLAEFAFRYNTRHQTDGQRTVAALRRAEGKRLMLRRPTSA